MGRMVGLVLCILGGLGIASCGPVYKTVYDFSPPSTADGRLCTSQCQQIASLCTRNCDLEEDACRSEARAQASRDYDRYVRRQNRDNQPIEKSVHDFTNTAHCYSSSSCKRTCEADYRGCFVGCGGEVTSREVCTAFCEQ